MYKRSLEKYNFDVVGVFASGAEAIDDIEKIQPDVILMDIMLKGKLDGIETVQRIKEIMNIPFIFITGNNDESTKEKALATKPLSYIVKPVNMKNISELINVKLQV